MQFDKISKNDLQFNTFLKKANEAYLARSNERIAYTPILAEQISEDEQIYVLIDNGEMVSGCCIYDMAKDVARLQHVWSDINKSRRGYASFLIDSVEEKVKEQGYTQLKLGVLSAYRPAYNLYKKKGWKAYALVANEPKTCYTISMVKYLAAKGKGQFERKRVLRFFFSKIKFFLFFKKDSTPKWLYKVFFSKR